MSHTLRDVTSFLKIAHIYLLYLFLFIMRKLFGRTLLMAIVLLAGASTAGARDKMTGVNGIRFGWKYDKCVEALGDPQRSVTTDSINEQRQYSYAPCLVGAL